MACPKRYDPWPRAWIEALHAGRKLVNGKPLKTYEQIAKELGTTTGKVAHAAQRYGTQRPDGKNSGRKFDDVQEAHITRLLEEGITMRSLAAKGLCKWLAAHGYEMSINRILPRVRKLSPRLQREYESNVVAVRRRCGIIGGMRSRIKRKARKDEQHGEDTRSESEGQDQGDTEEVQLLLRTAGDAGHGAERHA